MPQPSTPTEIDGIALSVEQQAAFKKLIAIIYRAEPTRRAEAVLEQASRSWRLLYAVVLGVWVRRAVVVLGGDEQGGAILRIPDALPPEEA